MTQRKSTALKEASNPVWDGTAIHEANPLVRRESLLNNKDILHQINSIFNCDCSPFSGLKIMLYD